MSNHRPKVLLVDGNNLLFRAFYANKWQSTKGAIYGFARMLNGFLQRHHYFDVIVAFDEGRTTFRHRLFADYKAQRLRLPKALIAQFKPVRAFLRASNIKYFELADYEADDILMTLARKADQAGYRVDILSGDQDLLQAISPNVQVLVPIRGLSQVELVDEAGFIAKYQFRPRLLPDYKALVGDSSDNFKGVTGIGPVVARQLIQKHGPIENIMAQHGLLPARTQHLLVNDQTAVRVCKKLATLIDDININYQFRAWSLDKAGQDVFFSKYGFRSLKWDKTNK